MSELNGRREGQRVIRRAMKRALADIILIYRLTEHPLPPNRFRHEGIYTLTVTKISCGGKDREVCSLPDVTRSRREAEQIFDLISRGLVTPCTLEEVIEDLMAI